MTNPFVVALAGQYNAALKMMEDAVRDCPDAMWQVDLWPDEAPSRPLPQGGLGGSAPWLLAHHALTIADYDLTGGFEPWEPPPPFDEHQNGEALRVFSQSELLGYVDVLRDRVRNTLDALTDESAARTLPENHRYRGTLYAQRLGSIPLHIVEHASQIRQFLTADRVGRTEQR